jgi:hypothetical protein
MIYNLKKCFCLILIVFLSGCIPMTVPSTPSIQLEQAPELQKDPSTTPIVNDDEGIRLALASHLGRNVNDLIVTITQNSGSHARGGVENGYFLAAKINGQWQIVADGQGALDCNVIAQYGFPESMVPECSPQSSPPSNQDALKAALAAHLGTDDNTLNITISQITDSHARGGVDNGYFFAAKVNGQWQIVADGQGALDCQIVANYGFPVNMVSECSPQSSPPSDEDLLKTALAAHLRTNVNSLSVSVNQNTGLYAKGSVDNGYFLAAKVNGQWQIVADGQGALDCNVVAQYGFPASTVPECSGTSIVQADEIKFKPGGTATYIRKTIKAGEQHTYSLNASTSQTIIVDASSEYHDVYIGIKHAQTGQQLVSNSSKLTSWIGWIPETGTYLITVTTDNPETVYFLHVEIPATIRFETGTNSATVNGHIEIFEDTPFISYENHVTYLVYASAGQTMDVKLSSQNIDALTLEVSGEDDGPYQRHAVKNIGYHDVLPVTQGYYLKVYSFKKSTDFTLEVTIY